MPRHIDIPSSLSSIPDDGHKTVGEILLLCGCKKSELEKAGGLQRLGAQAAKLYHTANGVAPKRSVRYYGKRPVPVNVYSDQFVDPIYSLFTANLIRKSQNQPQIAHHEEAYYPKVGAKRSC